MKEEKPVWDFKTSKRVAEVIRDHFVTAIKSHFWHDGGGVMSESWLSLHDGKKKCDKVPMNIIESGWNAEVEWTKSGQSMLRISESLSDRLKEIKDFETKNKREIAQYKRLKAKYGDTA